MTTKWLTKGTTRQKWRSAQEKARAWREMSLKERYAAHEETARPKAEEPPTPPLSSVLGEWRNDNEARSWPGTAKYQAKRVKADMALERIKAEHAKQERQELNDRVMYRTAIGAMLLTEED